MKKETSETVSKGGFEAFSGFVGSAWKSMERLKSKGMSEYGLSGTHTICVRRLFETPDGLTRTELAQCCGVDRAQITRIIGELLAKGYVTESGEGSRYRKKCVLTEKGKAVTAEINETVQHVIGCVSGEIPAEKMTVFYEVLEKICENLKQAEDKLDFLAEEHLKNK